MGRAEDTVCNRADEQPQTPSLLEPLNRAVLSSVQPPPLSPARWPVRAAVVVLTSCAAGIQLAMRANISVAVTKLPQQYQWADKWDGVLLAAFWIGYTLGNMPMSTIASHHGPRRTFVASLVLTALLNAAVPLVFRWPVAIVVLRVASGIVQAPTIPCSMQIISAWCLESELSVAVGILGVLQTLGSAGATASSNSLIGRFPPPTGLKLCFWIWSPPGLLAALLLLLCLPERNLRPATSAAPRVPWLLFATSPPLVACFVNHAALAFVAYTILMEIPLYMTKVLRPPPAIVTLTDSVRAASSPQPRHSRSPTDLDL